MKATGLYYFHPDMLADFSTVHEIGTRLVEALNAQHTYSAACPLRLCPECALMG